MLDDTPDRTPIDLLRSQTLSGLVQEEILRSIKTGRLEAGAKLNEITLAGQLRISRSPVREAFRALEEAGMVRLEKNRGVFIREVTEAEAAELYEVRRGLDEMTGRLLAPRITPAQLDELGQALGRLEAAAKRGDVDQYFPLNIAFHDRLVEMTGNTVLLALYRQLVDRMHLLRRRGFARAGSSAASHREHRAILAALARKDPADAAWTMGQHVLGGFGRTVGAPEQAA